MHVFDCANYAIVRMQNVLCTALSVLCVTIVDMLRFRSGKIETVGDLYYPTSTYNPRVLQIETGECNNL